MESKTKDMKKDIDRKKKYSKYVKRCSISIIIENVNK